MSVKELTSIADRDGNSDPRGGRPVGSDGTTGGFVRGEDAWPNAFRAACIAIVDSGAPLEVG